MRINFNNADLTIAVTRNSDNLHLVFHHVETIEERSAKDMIKDGYDVVKGRYVTIRLNAKGDYEIVTLKKTKDLIIDIIGVKQYENMVCMGNKSPKIEIKANSFDNAIA